MELSQVQERQTRNEEVNNCKVTAYVDCAFEEVSEEGEDGEGSVDGEDYGAGGVPV